MEKEPLYTSSQTSKNSQTSQFKPQPQKVTRPPKKSK